MIFQQTAAAATERLPLRPSPGPEMLADPPPGFGWEGLALALALLALIVVSWRFWRRRQPVVPSPRESALAALDRTTPRFETDPTMAFVEIADILRRYWTAIGHAPAETQTTAELLASIELPADIDGEQLKQALQQADQLKFAGISVTAEEARQWADQVKALINAPPKEQKTAPE